MSFYIRNRDFKYLVGYKEPPMIEQEFFNIILALGIIGWVTVMYLI